MKQYLKLQKELPDVSFHLVGSVTLDKKSYLEKLMNMASGNVVFHVNASIQEKIDVLCKSKSYARIHLCRRTLWDCYH